MEMKVPKKIAHCVACGEKIPPYLRHMCENCWIEFFNHPPPLEEDADE